MYAGKTGGGAAGWRQAGAGAAGWRQEEVLQAGDRQEEVLQAGDRLEEAELWRAGCHGGWAGCSNGKSWRAENNPTMPGSQRSCITSIGIWGTALASISATFFKTVLRPNIGHIYIIF